MQNGTVVFYESDINHWWVKLYKAFTGCNITHTAIICDDYYESTVEVKNWKLIFGVIKKPITSAIGNNVFIPKRNLTDKEVYLMKDYLDKMIGQPYNIIKLINILWIYPLRFIWNKIDWCPFREKFLGVLCSELVDKAYKIAGIDLLPDRLEDLTTPCDLAKSRFWK
jgi:hypothetical protein